MCDGEWSVAFEVAGGCRHGERKRARRAEGFNLGMLAP
jgi:hypothetical protein